MLKKLALIALTLWVGGLWITGFSAYTIFQTIESRQLAGNLAGHLFATISIIGMVAGGVLLVQRFAEFGLNTFKQAYFWALLTMLLLVLAGHFGIQPILAQMKLAALPNDVMNSVFAKRFSTWHGVASIAYVIECVLGFVLVLKK